MEDTAKNEITAISAAEGPCERGKADRYSVRSHKTLALPCGGSLGCSLADRICPYRNGLLPPVYANRVFSYPLLASNLHPPPMQCVDYQCLRKLGGVCWHSAMWQICKSLMIKCQSKSLIINCHSKLLPKQFKMPIGNHHFRSILDYQRFIMVDRQRPTGRNEPFNRARCSPVES